MFDGESGLEVGRSVGACDTFGVVLLVVDFEPCIESAATVVFGLLVVEVRSKPCWTRLFPYSSRLDLVGNGGLGDAVRHDAVRGEGVSLGRGGIGMGRRGLRQDAVLAARKAEISASERSRNDGRNVGGGNGMISPVCV